MKSVIRIYVAGDFGDGEMGNEQIFVATRLLPNTIVNEHLELLSLVFSKREVDRVNDFRGFRTMERAEKAK